MKGNNYNFEKLLCEACIIHENSYLSELSSQFECVPILNRAKNPWILGGGEEQEANENLAVRRGEVERILRRARSS